MLQIKQAVIAVGVIAVVVTGAPRPDSPPIYGPPTYSKSHQPAPYKEEPPKPYAFDYGVRDAYYGANFGHKETSDGNAITGSYQVVLPDGRIQTVDYVADHVNGFQAKVSYEGEAVYPEKYPEAPHKFKGAAGPAPNPQPYTPIYSP